MSKSTIEVWKKILETGETLNLNQIVHDQAVFYSPVVYTPQIGKSNVIKYLSSAVKIFNGKNFKYTNSTFFKNSSFYAEFIVDINNIEVNGIDIIKFDYSLIKEFKVFLRPLKGLEVMWSEMKNSLEEYDYNLSQK